MRKIFITVALATGVFAIGAGIPDRAQAMTVAPPAALGATLVQTPLEQAAYVCRPVRRCGPYGCGWRRSCFWTGGGPYAYYGWGGGPRWRHHGWRHEGWRGRHWR